MNRISVWLARFGRVSWDLRQPKKQTPNKCFIDRENDSAKFHTFSGFSKLSCSELICLDSGNCIKKTFVFIHENWPWNSVKRKKLFEFSLLKERILLLVRQKFKPRLHNNPSVSIPLAPPSASVSVMPLTLLTKLAVFSPNSKPLKSNFHRGKVGGLCEDDVNKNLFRLRMLIFRRFLT